MMISSRAAAAPGRSMRRAARLAFAALGVAAALVASASLPAAAQDFFSAQRGFVVDKTCDAYGSFKRRTNPTPLVAGRTYPARGINSRNAPSHAFIAIAGSGNKWVDLACGRFADGAAPDSLVGASGADQHPRPGSESVTQGAPDAGWASEGANKDSPDARGHQKAQLKCLPFFDTVDTTVKVKVGGQVDISPPAPVLDAFDTALTQTCGAPGKVVAAEEFKALLRAHPDALARIKAFTGAKVFANRPPKPDTAAYIDDLAEAWFAVKAFDHIFCGEPGSGRGKIGGLHFHARYLQLQQSGEACLMGNYDQNEVVPGVLYTTGVVMRLADGRVVRDARKGYGLTLSGEDLLKLITRAFAENPTASGDSSACLLPVRDDGKAFTAVFVRRAAGIRTFYPDATPSRRDPACIAPIALQ